MGIPEAIGSSPCDRADMQYVRARVPSISQVHVYSPGGDKIYVAGHDPAHVPRSGDLID